jgi:phosphate transport system substrate-binding protein
MKDRLFWAICMFVMVMGLEFVTTWLPARAKAETGATAVEIELPSYIPTEGVQGRFAIAGSNTMYPLLTRLAAEFRRLCPNVHIAIEGHGSKSVVAEDRRPFWEMVQNKAMYRRGDGSDDGHQVSMQVQVMASSRRLSGNELETFESRYGYRPMEIPISLEAVAVYVHRDNPITGLTLDQVDAIFSNKSRRGLKTVTTWGQLGLQDERREANLHLYGRDNRSGTRMYFKEQVLLNEEFQTTLQEMPGSASLILAVGQDPLAIGYSGIGYKTSLVRALPLATKLGLPFVSPSAESVTDGSYPLTRTLYLYINKRPSERLASAVQEFLKFVNSRQGQEIVVRAGVYALPLSDINRNQMGLKDTVAVLKKMISTN